MNLNLNFKRLYAKVILAVVFSLYAGAILSPLMLAAGGDTDQTTKETISSEEFIKSPASEFFQTGDYERALQALDSLIQQYPGDSLLIRYRAIALDRLGRTDEAIELFKKLLDQEPNHLPTRYFLGQAYLRQGKNDLAVQEWKWVIEHGRETPYEQWARSALEQVGAEIKPVKPALRRWRFEGRYGYEFDSNVILKPNDGSLATSRDENAGRHTGELTLGYRAYTRRDLAVDLEYSAGQSLHDDSLNEFNFTSQEFGLLARKRVKIGNRDVVLGGRYTLSAGFLDWNTFSFRNRWLLSADTRFTTHTRTVLSDRMSITEFGPDGSVPSRTSRDGFYNDVALTHYLYSQDFERYVFAREEFNSAHTRGDNFDKVGTTTRVGAHTPLVFKTDLDVSSGLELGFYPDFSSVSRSDLSKRRDIDWDLHTALTHHLTEHVSVRFFYRFINADNRNNFYDYDRHIGGAQVIFTQSF